MGELLTQQGSVYDWAPEDGGVFEPTRDGDWTLVEDIPSDASREVVYDEEENQ